MKILLASLLLLTSCSWFNAGCVIQSEAVKLATDTVYSTLQCDNKEAIYADLDALVSKTGICKATYQTGTLADVACPIVSAAVIQFVATNAIPVSWGCPASDAKQKLSAALLAACKMIPVSENK